MCPALAIDADASPHGEGDTTMQNLLVRLMRDDEGQDLVEYAMLVSLIALLCIAGVTAFGGAVNAYFTRLSTSAPIAAS